MHLRGCAGVPCAYLRWRSVRPAAKFSLMRACVCVCVCMCVWTGGWLANLETRRPRWMRRVDPVEWLYCGMQCLEEGRLRSDGKSVGQCQRAWPELRRLR